MSPGAPAPGAFQKKLKNQKLCKKMRKKSCTYLTMVRIAVKNFAPKCHRMRPGRKCQISDSMWDPEFWISCQNFVIFPQGAYDDILVRNFSRWCGTWSGTCMIFFAFFWKVFISFFLLPKNGSWCARAPLRISVFSVYITSWMIVPFLFLFY